MEAYMMTDVGMKRSSNQDYVFKTTDPIGALPNLFLLLTEWVVTKAEKWRRKIRWRKCATISKTPIHHPLWKS